MKKTNKENKSFLVGDRVGELTSQYQENDYDDATTGPLRSNDDDRPEYGVITDVLSNGKVLVKWDDEYRTQYPKYCSPQNPDDLALEEVVATKYSELETEFKK